MLHHGHHGHILSFTIAGFFTAVIIFIVIFYKPTGFSFPTPSAVENVNKTTVSDTDVVSNLNDRIKSLENMIALLSGKLDDQTASIQAVKTQVNTPLPQSTNVSSTKSIFAVANTKGSVFTTSASNYTPMGMYVNIRCPKNCYLWIEFYSSSQNTGSSPPQGGYTNTYALFLNETDQGIYSQASFPTETSSIPVSLNTAIPAAAGFYTIDIRAKTSGGILQSNVSSLQVMAIER